jgi:acyl-coenzyme A synthetase/AMP-(fatty) acid ligase
LVSASPSVFGAAAVDLAAQHALDEGDRVALELHHEADRLACGRATLQIGAPHHVVVRLRAWIQHGVIHAIGDEGAELALGLAAEAFGTMNSRSSNSRTFARILSQSAALIS